jgi:hypothetical protein
MDDVGTTTAKTEDFPIDTLFDVMRLYTSTYNDQMAEPLAG